MVRLPDLSDEERAQHPGAAERKADGFDRFKTTVGVKAPDFQHWARMPYWTIDEAAALLSGLEPGTSDLCDGKEYPNFEDLAERLKRSANAREVALRENPGVFIGWADRQGHAMPTQLRDAVISFGHEAKDWRARYEELLRDSERNTRFGSTPTATRRRDHGRPIGTISCRHDQNILDLARQMQCTATQNGDRSFSKANALRRSRDQLGVANDGSYIDELLVDRLRKKWGNN